MSCTYTIHIDVCFCPSSTTNVFQNQSWNNDVCHPSVKISYSDLKKPNNKGPSFRIVLLLTICEYFLTFRSAIHCLFHTPLKVVASCTCKSTLTLDKYMSKHFEPNGGHRLIWTMNFSGLQKLAKKFSEVNYFLSIIISMLYTCPPFETYQVHCNS